MLNELAAFGQSVRKQGASDALKQEMVTTDIFIDALGNFCGYVSHTKQPSMAEAIQAKKGKARLLLDKAEEVFGFEDRKHKLFLEKLDQYRHVPSLAPVLLFYEANRTGGLDKAVAAYAEKVQDKARKENFAFVLQGESTRIHEKKEVLDAVVAAFEARQRKSLKAGGRLCSVCGKADHPVVAEPHGMIKKVPSGQTSGCALVSYNEKAFESYGLQGNENSSICTACARNYVEGLNYLMGNGEQCTPEKGKPYYRYSNRKNLSGDTAMVFWTRGNNPVPELDYVDNTEENALSIQALIMNMPDVAGHPDADALQLMLNAPFEGRRETLDSVDAGVFYSCMLSGSAARIAVRSWIETSTSDVRNHLRAWFLDIAVMERDFTTRRSVARFFPLRALAGACCVHRKRDMGGKSEFRPDTDDDFLGRAATMLWNCALCGTAPPFTLLDRVLRRIRMEEGRITAARAALLKLILNRNMHNQAQGGQRMQPQLDQDNRDAAYIAGRIFAMLENIQTAALGNELNAPIRDRFFSAASTNPSSTFGRLIKLSQAHLSKLRGEKPGLAHNLDRKLGELFALLTDFPAIFSLEEQGRFAIGYYHQRQENFARNEPDQTTSTGA